MPSFDRELPSEHNLRHKHSISTNAAVPMWDSSDPDRAPPPLPLNPQSPTVTVATSRVGTSLAIQNAHAALTEKARENATPSPHKRRTDISPEKLPQRPNAHKRMQSLQPGSVRDISLMLEGSRDSASPVTSRGSPEKDRLTTPRALSEKDRIAADRDRFPRPSTPVRGREPEKEPKAIEKEYAITTGLGQTIAANIQSTMRSSVRWPQPSILGENTPPQSATMLALNHAPSQPTREPELPLATVTNNAAAQAKPSISNDHISNQLIALTNIANALHREMTALSRRSRDNATDLMSLKEATHARDEDIRKSLRDLVTNVDAAKLHRETTNGGLYIENKPFNADASKTHRSSFALPRIPSPNSFAASIDRESILSTPSLVGSETPATMALLEKIIRDMGTKEGQDMVFERLSELAERISGMASAHKVEELLEYLKTMREEHSMIRVAGNTSDALRSLSFDSISEGSTEETEWNQHSEIGPKNEQSADDKEGSESPVSPRPNEALNDDIIKIIRSVKDSVAQGGGLTAEVKALVRELRGEVLGMGRELGRKLEETGGRPFHSKSEASTREELAKIVEESLEQMKLYMQQRLREHRRGSTDSDFEAEAKPTIDYQEIYNAMRSAITDAHEHDGQEPQLNRDDVLTAVKNAWESYNPEIKSQNVGLGRDEVLACIKEGLQEVRQGATKEDIATAVAEGIKTTEPLSRDEVLDAVRECLEEFEFPVAPSALGHDHSRETVLHAVKQALDEFDFPDLSKALVPHDGKNAEILERLRDIMEYMHDELKLQHVVQYLQSEFKMLTEEARRNFSASEQNTEQVLDETKDGFETLRAHIEEYVDRIAEHGGPTGHEELMKNLVNNFDNFRDELSAMVTKTTDNSRELVKQEIESLRDAVNSSLVPHVPVPSDNRDVFEAIRESLSQVRNDLLRPHAGTTDILDALHEGFSEIRACIEKVTDKPVDLTANDEILDAFKSGMDHVRADIGTLRGTGDNERALAIIKPEPMGLMVHNDLLKHDDIKNLEVTVNDGIKNLEAVMTRLQSKVETMNAARPGAPLALEAGLSKRDLAELEDALRQGVSKDDLNRMEEMLQKAVSKEDLIELEDMLRNALAKEDLDEGEDGPHKAVSKEDLNDIKEVIDKVVSKDDLNELGDLLRNMQQSVARAAKNSDAHKLDDVATKEDVQAIETILRNTKSRLDDLIDGEQAVRRHHVDAVGALVAETKDSFGELAAQLESLTRKEDLAAIEAIVTKSTVAKTDIDAIEATVAEIKSVVERISNVDLKNVGDVVREIKAQHAAQGEAASTTISMRQAEVLSINERLADVQAFLEKFQTITKERLEAGGNGVEKLGRIVECLGTTINQTATAGSDLKQVLESFKAGFEEFKTGVMDAKVDSDEKLKEVADSLHAKMGEKIDELVAKYDDFQLVMDDRTRAGESRDIEMEAAVVGTKTVTEEVKVLMDTLGVTVTDSLEKMDEASKTVFDRVELLYGKTEDNHASDKHEHEMTREQVKQVIGAVEDLQGHVTDYQPKLLEAVRDVLLVAEQHYDHSHSKLAQLDTLDKVHQQVLQTAAEISEFLSSQKNRVEYHHDDRDRTLSDSTLALERQRAEQEYVTANLTMLRDEESQIRENILAMRAEQDALTRQKTRLTADVSSLETALQLRREELHAMDTRAEALERRIVEGVLDHSRALLMTKSGAKGREAMSRKRVSHSTLGSVTAESDDGKQATSFRTGANLAVKGNRVSLLLPQPNIAGGASRRIHSLNHPPHHHHHHHPPQHPYHNNGLARSHSVRTPVPARNTSWVPVGRRAGAEKGYGELDDDKAGVDSVRESDEDRKSSDDAAAVDSDVGTTLVTEEACGGGGFSDHDDGVDVVDGEDDDDDEDDYSSIISDRDAFVEA